MLSMRRWLEQREMSFGILLMPIYNTYIVDPNWEQSVPMYLLERRKCPWALSLHQWWQSVHQDHQKKSVMVQVHYHLMDRATVALEKVMQGHANG